MKDLCSPKSLLRVVLGFPGLLVTRGSLNALLSREGAGHSQRGTTYNWRLASDVIRMVAITRGNEHEEQGVNKQKND